MISSCLKCLRKTRQIDASVYAGDYHSDGPYGFGRQCVECGLIVEVRQVGKTVDLSPRHASLLPPRTRWEEPKL
jgi:hypothetical protein